MTLAALKASLALWKRRVDSRAKLLAAANQELAEARAHNTHPRQDLVDLVTKRQSQLAEAKTNVEKREKQIADKQKGRVRRPAERVKANVHNQSSRNGVKPSLIVLHDTEGANIPNSINDLKGLAGWFDNPAAEASSHVGVDSDGYSAQFVPDANKAWAQMAYNSVGLSIEQIGFATQKTWPEAQLDKVAQYVAYWANKYDIPLTHSTSHGVCQHSDLGAAGGSHHDCGPDYPIAKVIAKAKVYLANGW